MTLENNIKAFVTDKRKDEVYDFAEVCEEWITSPRREKEIVSLKLNDGMVEFLNPYRLTSLGINPKIDGINNVLGYFLGYHNNHIIIDPIHAFNMYPSPFCLTVPIHTFNGFNVKELKLLGIGHMEPEFYKDEDLAIRFFPEKPLKVSISHIDEELNETIVKQGLTVDSFLGYFRNPVVEGKFDENLPIKHVFINPIVAKPESTMLLAKVPCDQRRAKPCERQCIEYGHIVKEYAFNYADLSNLKLN